MKHKRTRLLGRIILMIATIVIAILLILTGIFNLYKDDIGRTILLRVNTVQSGELIFDDIRFNPFAHFPNITIELNDVDYFENKDHERGADILPIIKLEILYFAFDVIDLIKGNVIVSQIILKNGQVNLTTYADSTFNLTKAIGLHQDTLVNDIDKTKRESTEFELNLKRIALSGILIAYNNIPNKTNSSFSINTLNASFSIQDEKINSDLETNFTINRINQSGGFLLRKKQVKIKSSLMYSRVTNIIQIESSRFSFDKANFIIDGILDLNQTGFIDISVSGNDKDFSVLNLFLSETGMNNITGGNLFFNGIIKGPLFDEIPMIDFSFKMKDVEIQIPGTVEKITQFNLIGSFKSGEKKDLSQASLKIDELTGKLPGGDLNGFFSIENFASPVVDINFRMASDLYGFDKIFDLGLTDSLKGKINVNVVFNGSFDPSTKRFVSEVDSSVIVLENVSFNIPEVNQVSNVNGKIQFKNDTTFLDNFELEVGKSDFNINGSLMNLYSLLINVDERIEGDLLVRSNTYDFPDFFNYDIKVAESFPYQINEINLNVNVSTTMSDLTDFIVSPEIVFDIQSLEAEISDFLPPIKINAGVFTLGDIDSSLNLDFSDFDIEIAGSNLLADVVFNSPEKDPNWLTVGLKANNLNPKETFVYWSQDSISDLLNGIINGSMNLNLVFSLDSIAFDRLDFSADELGFNNSKDTFDLQKLSFNAKNIDFEISNSSKFMETLSFDANLFIKVLSTDQFEMNDFRYDLVANNRVFRISSFDDKILGGNGEGSVVIKPFGEMPRYEFNYKVQQLEVSELFNTFREDTIISGKMDLDIELVIEGSSRNEIEHNLNGKILLKGRNLTMHGLDLDKVIDRFKRSQKFTLADVSAMVLMGPAGLLVTKGSDFASIVILNPGELTELVELSSDWEVNDGLISLIDVAVTTQENRMAAKGWANLITDSLIVEIALLNELGCSVYSQEMFGSLDSIELSKVKVVKSLLAPVTNLVSNESKCDVFYNGKVKQPAK